MAQNASQAAKTRKSAKTTTAKKRGKKRTSTLLKSLPESMENIELVQQVAGILEEMQTRVKDVKVEAGKELKKLMKLYEGNYKGLEKKLHQVTSEAKKQAQTGMLHIMQKWHEHKEKLPAPLANEVEKIVAQIGAKAVTRKKKDSAPKKATTAKKSTATTSKKTKKTAAPRKKRAAKTTADTLSES